MRCGRGFQSEQQPCSPVGGDLLRFRHPSSHIRGSRANCWQGTLTGHAVHSMFALASRRSRACGRSAFLAKNNSRRPLHIANSCQATSRGRSSTDSKTRVSAALIPHLTLNGTSVFPGYGNSLLRGCYNSSAASEATLDRSHDCSVMWPKHGCPVKALVSTANTLFVSPK